MRQKYKENKEHRKKKHNKMCQKLYEEFFRKKNIKLHKENIESYQMFKKNLVSISVFGSLKLMK